MQNNICWSNTYSDVVFSDLVFWNITVIFQLLQARCWLTMTWCYILYVPFPFWHYLCHIETIEVTEKHWVMRCHHRLNSASSRILNWDLVIGVLTTEPPGPSCSKLTMSLVNVWLKLWSLYMAYMLIFLLQTVSAFAFAKASHIFSAKIPINLILYLLNQWTLWPLTSLLS